MGEKEKMIKDLRERIFRIKKDLIILYSQLALPLDEESRIAFDLIDGRYSIIEDIILSKDTDVGDYFNAVIGKKNSVNKLDKLWRLADANNIYRTRDSYDKILGTKWDRRRVRNIQGKKQVASNDLTRRYYNGSLLFTNGVLPGFVLFLLLIRDGELVDKHRIQIFKSEKEVMDYDRLTKEEREFFYFISETMWFINSIFAPFLQKIDQIYLRGIVEVNEYQKQVDALKKTSTVSYSEGLKLNKELKKRTDFVENGLKALQKVVKHCKSKYELPSIEKIKKECEPFDALQYKIEFLYQCLGWLSRNYCKELEPIFLEIIKIQKIRYDKEDIRERFKKIGELSAEIFPAPEKYGVATTDENDKKRKAIENYLKKLETLLEISPDNLKNK